MKKYLIQTQYGATLYAFVVEAARDHKLAELQDKYPRTVYKTKETS